MTRNTDVELKHRPLDHPERSLRHIAWMIGNCRVAPGRSIEPDLMTPGGLPVKLEAQRLQLANDLSVADPASRPMFKPRQRWCSRAAQLYAEESAYCHVPAAPLAVSAQHLERFPEPRPPSALARQDPAIRQT